MKQEKRELGGSGFGSVDRRRFLQASAGVVAGGMAMEGGEVATSEVPWKDFRIANGRIKQSVMGWCFNPMPTEDLLGHLRDLGFSAVEGIDTKFYPRAREMGLDIGIVGSHGFAKGPVNPENHEFCRKIILERIELCAREGYRRIITFTGMREKGISDVQSEVNCVEFWKSVIGEAEEKGVDLCLEHLNSRDDSHPMKGHPGYFGDDVDHCVEMIRKVGSPNMKLLFDIYHVQIMNGDVIRRLRQYRDVIGHIHTAGNPGRRELDDQQEIQYRPIMKEIVDLGFEGYVAQEFIPTWSDPVEALRHAAWVCDV